MDVFNVVFDCGFSLAIIPILDKRTCHRLRRRKKKGSYYWDSVIGLALSIGIVCNGYVLTVPVRSWLSTTPPYVLFVPIITLLFGKKIP